MKAVGKRYGKKVYAKSPSMKPSKAGMKSARPTSIKKKTDSSAKAVRKKLMKSPLKKR